MTVGFLVIREFVERIEEDISAVAVLHIFFDAFFFLPKNPIFVLREAFIGLCFLYNGYKGKCTYSISISLVMRKDNERMDDYLRKVLTSDDTGLYLCELPTGFGKTYTVSQLIAEFVRNDRSGRKIIYLTTLNKNLPEGELRAALGEADYEKSVLRIRANFDEVVEKLLDIEAPEEFQTEDYSTLVKTIRTTNTLCRKLPRVTRTCSPRASRRKMQLISCRSACIPR